ncbi:hypothetical protein CDL15_Pgr001572 [Punica granatum]|uniref:Reverse transcriptase domain-containing protein n=1 Tax=Punica granatum TaxID=22663 RepID=A0A218XBC3_PUNGR|nr:hypothetical protein CDL15_Pgr001572 [Punica granatum]
MASSWRPEHSFFFPHKMVKVRKAKNSVRVLYTDVGQKLEDPSLIADEAVRFYQKLLGTTDPVVNGGDVSTLQSLLNYKVLENFARDLINPVTEDEIKSALWSMNGDRAPGLDGYTAQFFKASKQGFYCFRPQFLSKWQIIG